MKKEKYVVDTCTLIHFYIDLNCPDLLIRLYSGRVYVVSEVVREYSLFTKLKSHENLLTPQISRGEVILADPDIYDPKIQEFITKFSASLGKGELFSAALAKEKGLTLISDNISALNELLFKGAGIKRKTSKDVLLDARKSRLLTQREYQRYLRKINQILRQKRRLRRHSKRSTP